MELTNEELVCRIQAGSAHYLQELWENNKGLIASVARRYRDENSRLYDITDLLQAGYLGLHVAAMTYSSERGANFSTYAVFHIRRAMHEAVGLRGKRDVLLDAVPLDAPLDDDGDDTLLDLIPAPQGECPVELADIAQIVRDAVGRIRDTNAREIIQVVYWQDVTVADFARSAGIARQTANERLQKGYAILRRDWRILSLALIEGYDTNYSRYKGLSDFKSTATSPVEDVVILQEKREHRQKCLYENLGNLVGSYFLKIKEASEGLSG